MIRNSLRDRGGGVILVVIGGYYVLRNTLGLDLRDDAQPATASLADRCRWPRLSGPSFGPVTTTSP